MIGGSDEGGGGAGALPVCVMVMVAPATVNVSECDSDRVLFVTLYLTVPEPLPPRSTTLMSAVSLHAFH